MKHIEKKFSRNARISDEMLARIERGENVSSEKVNFSNIDTVLSDEIVIISSDKTVIEAARFGKMIIPEPDPVCIYFDIAYQEWCGLIKHTHELDRVLEAGRFIHCRQELFNFYGSALTFVNSLYSSIEAAMNRVIPNDIAYPQKNKARNKKWVIRWVSSDEKLTSLMRFITKKNFAIDHPQELIIIKELRDLRNDTIHIKEETQHDNLKYKGLIGRLRFFDFEKAIYAAKIFINYHFGYELISDCTCGSPLNDHATKLAQHKATQPL